MEPLSIRDAFAGRHVFLTGASGFLGKVWLVQLLDLLPEIERIYVLVRPKSGATGAARLADLINHSPIFEPLHNKHGEGLSDYISGKVEVVEGVLQEANFGIREDTLTRLRANLDLVVNCAGLTEFNPDPRLSLSTNVEGAVNGANFVRSCEKAKLVHISTCYVVGKTQGRIKEFVPVTVAGSKDHYDPDQEYEYIQKAIADICESKEFSEELSGKRARIRAMRLRRELINLGTERAEHWGWPNIYTYCKAMAERLLTKHHSDITFTIFRPAIVESAISYPFPGWNEGIDGSGPLACLLGTWFRDFPSRPGNPFDIIPVDLVVAGMTIASAAILKDCHRPVYQCGTSDLNRLTIDRGCELTALEHRRYYRKNGDSWVERFILARWEAYSTEEETLFGLDNLRSLTKSITSMLRSPPSWLSKSLQDKSKDWAHKFEKGNRKLKPIEKMMEAYRPFTLENRWIFETRSLAETPIAEEEFRWDPNSFCWREWWLNTHMPALRKWCFPRIEGKQTERYSPVHKFHWTQAESADSDLVTRKKVG
ncbi:MAG: SDR family oxidoreductase [Planctomycetota bacterium]|nr:SDR family oxidoreductase [Planctomycetota bacterium]